jgi:hypothetical protein
VCTLFLGTNSCCAQPHDVLVFSRGTRVVPQHQCVQCEAITNHARHDKDILLTTWILHSILHRLWSSRSSPPTSSR